MWILIAFVAAIGLTALAIMAVFGEFGSASSSQSAQSVVMGVSAIISNILTDYAANPDFNGIDAATVGANGALPASWTVTGTGSNSTAALPGGGSLAIAPVSGTTSEFSVTLSDLNAQTCAQFGTFYTPNVTSIAVAGATTSTATNPSYNGGAGTTGWPPALANNCGSGTNTVTINVAGQ